MKPNQIRPVAICVFMNDGKILVNEAFDPIENQIFYRPLGGGIEFGENSAQTIVREIQEEINAEVINLRLIGSLENIFVYLGAVGHEIVQIYDGEFVDQSLYQSYAILGQETDGKPFTATWHNLDDFVEKLTLYPDGLLQQLQSVYATSR